MHVPVTYVRKNRHRPDISRLAVSYVRNCSLRYYAYAHILYQLFILAVHELAVEYVRHILQRTHLLDTALLVIDLGYLNMVEENREIHDTITCDQ